MNIKDMNKKPSSAELNQNLVERFNLNVTLENYSFNDLVNMRTILVSKINRMVESNNFDYTHKDEYQKNRLFAEILEAEIEARRPLVEGEEMKARLVVGISQVIDDVKNWMQKANDLKADEVLEYTEIVRDEMGADTSQQFGEIVNTALENLYTAMEAAHGEMLRAQDVIMGKDPGTAIEEPIGAEEPMDEPAVGDADMELDDDFGATAPAAGGDASADRTRRESIERSRRLGAIMSEGNLSDYIANKKTAQQRKAVRGGKGRAKAAGKADPRATDTTLGGVLNQERRTQKHQQKKRVTNPANHNAKDGM